MAKPWPDAAIVGTSVAAGILVAGLIGGVGTAVSNAGRLPAPVYTVEQEPDLPLGDYSLLETGEPGDFVPVAPMDCVGACFDETSVVEAELSDGTFAGFGFPEPIDVGDPAHNQRSAADLLLREHDEWTASGFPEDGCFVTWSDSPIVEPVGPLVGADVVASLTKSAASGSSVSRILQSVRLFPDAGAAGAYMSTLAAGVASCTGYRNDQNYGFEVSAEPALTVPESVAAVGFVKSPEPGLRYYVFDLQRGNMVIRTVAVSDGAIDDRGFRVLVRQQAEALAELVPLS